MDKGPKSAYSFLSGFGAFLKSEMKFSKLLVQPPHHLVTCAHHKKFLTLSNKLRLLWYIHATDDVHLSVVSYIISCYCHVAQDVLFSHLCYSLTPQNLKSLVHRINHYGKCKMVDLVVIKHIFYTFLLYFL